MIMLRRNILMAPRWVSLLKRQIYTPSFMPTPNYDPRFHFPLFDQTQSPPQMHDVSIPPSKMLVTSQGCLQWTLPSGILLGITCYKPTIGSKPLREHTTAESATTSTTHYTTHWATNVILAKSSTAAKYEDSDSATCVIGTSWRV